MKRTLVLTSPHMTGDDVKYAQRVLGKQGGYYQGKAEITTKAEAPDRFRVLVAVAPGPQFHFASIRIAGPETEPPGIARQALTLAPGDPIVAASVMAAEANVTLRLPEQGYPFVKVGDRDIALDPNGAKGDYTLPVDPGPRSSFGAIEQREQVFDARHLRVIARFKPGQPYDQTYFVTCNLSVRRDAVLAAHVPARSVPTVVVPAIVLAAV